MVVVDGSLYFGVTSHQRLVDRFAVAVVVAVLGFPEFHYFRQSSNQTIQAVLNHAVALDAKTQATVAPLLETLARLRAPPFAYNRFCT